MINRNIVEESNKNIISMDVFSKLAQNRILFIDDVIDDVLANGLISQLLYLDSLNNNEISIYINSVGGSAYSGLAIIDIMNIVKSPIKTVCVGTAMSMAAFILICGDTRASTENSTIMLHQLSTGDYGRLTDLEISFKEAERIKNVIYNIVKEKVNIPDFDNKLVTDWYLDPIEAKELGIIDSILYGKSVRKQ